MNHLLRPRRFVTQKIIAGAADIAEKKTDVLELGNLNVTRDFGWAPEYVEAMAAMLSTDAPEDFVIATGQSNSLEEFAAEAFAWFGLNWRDHVKVDKALFRSSDITRSVGNANKAGAVLGWKPKVFMSAVVAGLAEAEMRERRGDMSIL